MDEKNEQKTTSAALREWTSRARADEHMDLRELDTIADELNATLGRGTCHPIISDNLNESEGAGDAWADCSECGHLLFVLTDPTSEPPNYCPNCGRRIVEVDG